jgi:hypothetical protein
MKILKVISIIFIVFFLTVLTQVGGVVYLFSRITFKKINSFSTNKFKLTFYKLVSFLLIYAFSTFLLVPLIAKPFGRVPLPYKEKNHLQPLNFLTCFLNRNYVKSELRESVLKVANQMNEIYPGTTINYLDANFPFINKFPLFPHLSHNDGKKLDLSFCYNDAKTGKQTNNCPSFIGYGIIEEPTANEINTASLCDKNGNWEYSLLSKIVSQKNKVNYSFNKDKTRSLVTLFASANSIGKIFIEPHLKIRLGLTSNKIKFQGCKSVRHDDHLHIQLK